MARFIEPCRAGTQQGNAADKKTVKDRSKIPAISILVLVLPFVSGCTALPAPRVELPPLEGLRITYSHAGSSPNLGSLRMGESGAREHSSRSGDDYWLQLTNNSPFAISFPTQSMYIANPIEWVPVGPGQRSFAVADNSEVAVLFDSFEGRYGFGCMSSVGFLPAGRTILFSVPKRYLRKNRSISIEITAYTPGVVDGTEKPPVYAVSFAASDLPK
jgi:hypothetical protein